MEITINGLNSTAIAAIFEALITGEGHWGYETARGMAEEFCKTHREELAEALRKDMREHMPTGNYAFYNID